MEIKDLLYIALSTIVVMVILQGTTFMVTRMMYPPEPKVIYRDVFVPQPAPLPPPPPPAFTQETQQTQIPEYEPRKPASTSLRLDTELPDGIQETRPEGM